MIGVHVDRHHIHAHLIFNSVNAGTGEKYHSNARSYYQQIWATSDRLCREHGLSVIMEGSPNKHFRKAKMASVLTLALLAVYRLARPLETL